MTLLSPLTSTGGDRKPARSGASHLGEGWRPRCHRWAAHATAHKASVAPGVRADKHARRDVLWLGLPAGISVLKKGKKPVQVPPRPGRQIPGRKGKAVEGGSGAAHGKPKAGVGTVPIDFRVGRRRRERQRWGKHPRCYCRNPNRGRVGSIGWMAIVSHDMGGMRKKPNQNIILVVRTETPPPPT